VPGIARDAPPAFLKRRFSQASIGKAKSLSAGQKPSPLCRRPIKEVLMKFRLSLVATTLVLAISAVVALGAPVASAAAGKGSYAVPADGTTASGAPVTGTFGITKFTRAKGVVTAVGTFTGTVDGQPVTSAASAPVTTIDGTSLGGNAAAAAAAADCSILNLTLGPLHLDLLGLVVDLNQVNLQITGQQGPGDLLGNLLCGVAGLLDNTPANGGVLQQITNLLNQILAAL
jgi:hypothetical protein